MDQDHSLVQWTLPRWAADLIRETIELDAESPAFDLSLREEICAALDQIHEIEPAAKPANGKPPK